MTKPSVSIAMATYNGERFIAEQLDSFAKQTVAPAELVVTDDGSADRTLEIIAAFAAKVPFAVHIEKNAERLGYRTNFIKAAALCRSDIIAFCDQDDVWLPHKLERCLSAFDDADVLLAYHNATVTDENLKPIGTMDSRAAPRAINRAGTIDPWLFPTGNTQMMRRDFLSFIKLWPQSFDFLNPGEKEAHDQWFFFLASYLGSIAYVHEPLVLYRQHSTNTFGVQPPAGVSIGAIIRNIREGDAHGLKVRETTARQRAVVLEQLEPELEGERRQRARNAATAYRDMERILQMRQDLYRPVGWQMKLGRLATLIGKNAYRSRQHGGVGYKAMARDIVRGVIIPSKAGQTNTAE